VKNLELQKKFKIHKVRSSVPCIVHIKQLIPSCQQKRKQGKNKSTRTSTYVFCFGDETELFFGQNFGRPFLVVALVFVHLDFIGRCQVIGAVDSTRLRHDYVTLRLRRRRR